MTSAEAPSRELLELRRCVRDLAALAALPIVWATSDGSRVVESLADALLGMLRLDFVFIRFRGGANRDQVEVGRLSGHPRALESNSLGGLLGPWLDSGGSLNGVPQLPGCSFPLRGLVVPFGLDGASGMIAGGCARSSFPSESEHLLLRVAANQAAVILARQRNETDRERAQAELRAKDARLLEAERRRAALLAKVAQASRSMNAVLSVEAITGVLTQEARAIIGAHQAAVTLAGDDVTGRIDSSVDRDRLVVPLAGHGTKNIGLIQLWDKIDGGFTDDDLAVLQQLAATAAVGIENARLYDSLKEQDRRKDEFLAMLAHELRNPLAPVRSGLDVLNAMGATSKVAVDTRDMMGRQIRHMVRLIDDLMDVSRISQGKLSLKMETVRLRDIVESAVEGSTPLIRAGRHSLDVQLPPPDVQVHADTTRLAQVIGNLLNNAAKYTPDGGRIRLSVQREGGDISIEVADNGVGISAEMLPKIFELFTQAGRSIERAQGGLGIGLALARKLVEMHSGTLDAASIGPGQGSTFTVRLHALSAAAEEAGVDGPADREHTQTDGLRVLVVDDNVDAAQTLSMMLDMLGHRTATAMSGPQALDQASAFRPQVIFLDIGLPGMSGYDVARHLRGNAQTAAATIVALTGWGSESDRLRARQAGFDHHLTKPIELSSARSILDEVASRLRSAVPS